MRLVIERGLALLLVAQAGAASAQHPLVLNRLQEINAQAPQPSAEQIEVAILATAAARGEASGACVPQEIDLGEIAPITGARDVLQAVLGGQVRNGWSVYATHRGCPGGTEISRYMVVQQTDGSLLAPLVNEGRSYANPSIMRDTSSHAALAALQKARDSDPTCDGRDMAMGATRVTSQSEDLGPEIFGVRYIGSWTEIWRFETCDRVFDVPVEFRADGDGGAYTSVKGEEVALVRQPEG